MSDQINLLGKPTTSIGSLTSLLLLKNNGSIKLQWGNKYIDLIKNGKINTESQEIIFNVSSEDEIKKNGIYLIDDKIWINVDGVKLNITQSDLSLTVLFSELLEKTAEEKQTAMKNIGFIYDTLEDAKQSGITDGLVYILNELTIYKIINGEFEIYVYLKLSESLESNKKEVIINGESYIVMEYDLIDILKSILMSQDSVILSKNFNYQKGFKIYFDGENYVLDIDKINNRNERFEIYTGMIMMFDNINDIPDGWQICDENCEINLSEKFITIDEETNRQLIYIIKL